MGKFLIEYMFLGIEKDYVYVVRVVGYSFGGIGRKFLIFYFILGMIYLLF